VVKIEVTESQQAFLRRLAVVFGDPLRLKIVTELYMQAMSPTQFLREFGGGSVSRVDYHFKTLVKYGWLQLERRASGGERRGGTEHLYRAPQLAVFDNDTWSRLPYSIKVAFSWTIFGQFVERARDAMEANTFDARPDRHFTWTPILLDERGWEEVIAAVDSLFASLFREQIQAKRRIAQSNAKPILATVALGGFESPMRFQDMREQRSKAVLDLAESVDSPTPFTVRISKVFGDPVCLKIVTELNLRDMSPTQFFHEFGGASISGCRRRFRLLNELGWLRKTGAKTGGKRRRGATENFYRATGPAIFDNDSWSQIPASIKSTYSWRILEQLSEQVKDAIEAGTLDARPDRHLSWSLLLLDQLGWEHVISAIDAVFDLIRDKQEHAKARIAESAKEPFRATITLAAFESPKGSKAL
jgi:hypothetical protein